jgi:hypothetical protein
MAGEKERLILDESSSWDSSFFFFSGITMNGGLHGHPPGRKSKEGRKGK